MATVFWAVHCLVGHISSHGIVGTYVAYVLKPAILVWTGGEWILIQLEADWLTLWPIFSRKELVRMLWLAS